MVRGGGEGDKYGPLFETKQAKVPDHTQNMVKGGGEEDEYGPLFETKQAKGRIWYRLFSISIFIGICLIWVYRLSQIPGKGEGRWAWILLFGAELWFSLYWVLTQSVRWNRIYRRTFKHRLSHRYEKELPGVDVFVCTADPIIEPPMLVINTVLSVMSYNYPSEKLSVYLSDDGGSDLVFYALLEASHFSKYWIPFCKKFNIEPRSPGTYFSTKSESQDLIDSKELSFIKKLYEEMENRIETATKLGQISEEIRAKHKGFSEWASISSQRDHQTILQILIDERDPRAVDIEGRALPSLVYLAREKRPKHPHNYKAGAMNALIRVSSKISNGKIILNVDCDMYSNNSDSVRDALCFFMDEEQGNEIAFVQFPQCFGNITKNDVYGGSLRVINEVELNGLDGYGGPAYIGTGCFHRREILYGKKYTKDYKCEWKGGFERKEETVSELKETSKILASCTYEEGTQWGNQMGLKYGCPVEDVITGLSIQCLGWKSVYFNPARKGFLGIAPTTLAQTLVQHKRWSEGDLQILVTKYSPLSYGLGRIRPGLQMGYCVYCLWAPNSIPTLCYLIVPPLCLFQGIPLFPQISNLWFLPFAYVIIAKYMYSLGEYLWSGGTIQGWWNEQRIWMFKRTTSYLFGFIDNISTLFGFAKSAFDITSKVVDHGISQRYEKEIMEFGISSSMFTIIATLALLNLFSLVGWIERVIMDMEFRLLELFFLQVLLSGLVVVINIPVYQGLFFRKDNGRLPASLTFKSIVLAILICMLSLY